MRLLFISDEIVELVSSSSNLTLSQQSSGSNFSSSEFQAGPSAPKRSCGSTPVITEKLAAVLDRSKVTDGNAVQLIIATAQALHCDVTSLIINRTSIRAAREKYRESLAIKIKEVFKNCELNSATVHFDGKLLPNLPKRESFERLPIVISDGKVEQLIAIPELENGKGSTQARAVYEGLADWGLCDKIKAVCCDTTSSNLGHHSGAVTVLEQLLDKKLLYFPCRHHIFELVLRGAFEEKMPGVCRPNVPLFQRFQGNWKNLDQSKYDSGLDDKNLQEELEKNKDAINFFVKKNLENGQPRGDYEELLKLTQIFIGESPVTGVKFRHPGAFHHARWMSKAIYSLKIYLFRQQFNLTPQERRGLSSMCLFIVLIYVKAWFVAPYAAQAPNHDLQFLKELTNYQSIDKKISQVALKKISNHLWYLNPQTAAMAFFDKELSVNIKKNMVTKLKVSDEINQGNCNKIVVKNIKDIEEFLDKEMDFFINSGSVEFFERYGIDTEFLNLDPLVWNQNKNFQKGLAIVKGLKVINDCAERAVNLVQNYNNILTTNEEQKQFILQVTAVYRKQFPDSTKATNMKEFKI